MMERKRLKKRDIELVGDSGIPAFEAMRKNKMGRPSKFDPKMIPMVEKLCKLGATDLEVADFFDVSYTTFKTWLHVYPDLLAVLKVAKEEANDRVKMSLYRKATGYSFDAVKIFMHEGKVIYAPYREHVPPDTTAMIFWSKNRMKDEFRDVQHHQHDGEIDYNVKSLTVTADMTAKDAAELYRKRLKGEW